MNPVEITQGKSFKGLSAYLLHDEKRQGEEARTTSERVGWSQTYNLVDADAGQAWRLMLATANSANALKEAVGIKKGKPVKNTVYHYSINFNPDDELTPEIQQRAVSESLKALGLEDHQALAVEHTDKAHNHIHVMVNLIDPTNGMSAASPQMGADGKKRSKLSNSRRKLSSWAKKFERDNGLIITEGRLANANKREQGEQVDAKRKPRNVHEQEKNEPTDRRRDFMKRQHNERAKEIQAQTVELKEQSRTEWDALKQSYYAQKDAIKADRSPALKERAAEIKTLFKPYWADMFKRHRDEVKAFEAGDRTTIGKIWHGAAAFRELALDGDYLGGFVAAFSKENRRNIVLKKHDRETKEMRERLSAQISQELGVMKHFFNRQLSQARERFTEDCDRLKSKQDVSWAEIREAWQDYNNARAAVFSQAKSRQNQIAQNAERGRGMNRRPS
jgi:hypothetical protein